MIKYKLKILLLYLPLLSFHQTATDQVLHLERAIVNELKRLPLKEIIHLIPHLFEACPVLAFIVPCLPPLGFLLGNRISSGFVLYRHSLKGKFQHNSGIDIAGNHQFVRKTATGLLEKAAYDIAVGLFVFANYGNSYQTIYGHLVILRKKKSIFTNWRKNRYTRKHRALYRKTPALCH